MSDTPAWCPTCKPDGSCDKHTGASAEPTECGHDAQKEREEIARIVRRCAQIAWDAESHWDAQREILALIGETPEGQ